MNQSSLFFPWMALSWDAPHFFTLLILTLTSAFYKAFLSIYWQKVKIFKVEENIKQLTYVHLRKISLCLMWHCYSLSFCVTTGPSHTQHDHGWYLQSSSSWPFLKSKVLFAFMSFYNTLFSSGLQKYTLVIFLISFFLFYF